MHMMIEGQRAADNEPFMMPLGGVLDQQRLPGPIGKDRLEDLQLWSELGCSPVMKARGIP
jgi:hypothetical protein